MVKRVETELKVALKVEVKAEIIAERMIPISPTGNNLSIKRG